MEYVVEMGSGAMTQMPRFLKIVLGIQILWGGETHVQTRRQQGDIINILLFCRF
jgi:hypothetical protein